MLKLEVIGNLGADAELREYNGKQFVAFRLAHSESWNDQQGNKHESTVWVSCTMNGNAGGLLQYLKTGTKVFVRGDMTVRVYSSPATHQMEAGVNLNVREVELCGVKQQTAPVAANAPLPDPSTLVDDGKPM